MKDHECVPFLEEHLPRLRLRWAGFRKVRGQVCKRIARRLGELGISDLKSYRRYLRDHASEWDVLYALCRVTISRFYRDRRLFDYIRAEVLPAIAGVARANGEASARAWSAGCASGEEAYTLQIIWKLCVAPPVHGTPLVLGVPPVSDAQPVDREPPVRGAPPLHVTATDAEEHLLERARKGLYPASALKDLPGELMTHAFDSIAGGYAIREAFKRDILFVEQDIRKRLPDGPFHLVLCRNLVFTYFDEPLQEELLAGIIDRLEPGGFLVIGAHEKLPARASRGIDPHGAPCVYRKKDTSRAPRPSNGPDRQS